MKRQEEKTIIEEPVSTSAMICLEVITVRVAGKDDLENALNLCMQVSPTVEIGELVNLSIYRSNGYGSDISVHIQWALESFSPKKSLLGLQLARGLSAFGIVSHTLWIDQEIILK